MRKKFVYTLLLAFAGVFLSSCGNNNKSTKNETLLPVEADAAHNSRNSLDYVGVYTGIIPCADCPGINLELTLLEGEKYVLTTAYQGEKAEGDNTFTQSGKYAWNDKGNIIMLDDDETQQYQVGENVLFGLDIHGKRMTGEFADMYILRKK